MITWLTKNAEAIGAAIAVGTFLLTLVSFAFTAFRYVEVRRREQAQQAFENYHKLIAELVGGARDNQITMLDSQIAVIYELRRFKQYKEVTVRILKGLHAEWSAKDSHPRLLQELQLTIGALS